MDLTRIRQIEEAIERAKEQAVFIAEIELYEQGEAEIIRDFLNHKIDRAEYDERLRNLTGQPQRVVLNSIEELEFVFNYLNIGGELRDSIIDHECRHFETARKGLLRARFVVTFFVEDDGRLACQFGCQMNITNPRFRQPNEQIKEAMRNAIGAPLDPSEQDLRMLEKS